MRKTVIIIRLFFIAGLLLFSGCAGGGGGSEVPKARILTGPPGLTVHTLGSTLSEYVKDSLLLSVEPGSTNGNVMAVNAKEAEFGISMTTSVVTGYNGTHFYEGKEKLQDVRIIATLWHHYVLPITTDMELTQIEQLRNKKFTSGPPGGDAEPLAKLLLNYVGLGETDYDIIPFGFTEGAEALKNRQIDALFSGAPYPNPIQEDLGKTVGGRYMNVGKENAEQLVRDYDGLYLVEFKEGAQGLQLDQPYYTASYKAVLITHTDVPEDVVYEMAKGLYENYERLGNALGNMRTFPIEDLMGDVGEVPYHEGAVKLYKEVGLTQ